MPKFLHIFALASWLLAVGDFASGQGHVDDAVARWLQSEATPISEGLKQANFGPFEEQAAAARVVGLGEATHGQHETFDLKRALTMHLIRNHGFRVVAYEASASKAVDCNAYISGEIDDPKKALGGLGMLIWQVEENRQLLDDLRSWNGSAKPNERVRFVGADAQSGGVIVKRLEELLGDRYAGEVEQCNSLLERSGPAVQKSFTGDRADLEKLLADANSVADQVRRLAKDQALNVVAIDLRLQELIAHLGLYASVGARDKAMAELLLAQLTANEKCVFWGHNAHVQRSALTHMNTDALAMGGHLAKTLGNDYYALGFAFGEGEFQANKVEENGHWRFQRYVHSPPPEGSLDALFQGALDTDFIIDFRSAPEAGPVHDWLTSPHGHRWWGGYHVPDDFDERTSDVANLSKMTPALDFDGMAFHRTTTAAQPVDADLLLPAK